MCEQSAGPLARSVAERSPPGKNVRRGRKSESVHPTKLRQAPIGASLIDVAGLLGRWAPGPGGPRPPGALAPMEPMGSVNPQNTVELYMYIYIYVCMSANHVRRNTTASHIK